MSRRLYNRSIAHDLLKCQHISQHTTFVIWMHQLTSFNAIIQFKMFIMLTMLHSVQLSMELKRWLLEYIDAHIVLCMLQTLCTVRATSYEHIFVGSSLNEFIEMHQWQLQTCCFWNSTKMRDTLSKYETFFFCWFECYPKKRKIICDKAKPRWWKEHCHRISLGCAANILPFMEWIGCWAFYQLKCV